MIRTNSTQKPIKLSSGQSLSPFNSAIRLSSQHIEAPSTPQRQVVTHNPLKMIVNQEVRNSNAFTPNSKLQQQFRNQENKSFVTNDKIQQLINDNNYLAQALEQTRAELRKYQENQDIQTIRHRMENLENVIDTQAMEIDEWKKKYHQLCTLDGGESMHQMEQQILLVIQENERLNLLVKNIQEAIDAKDNSIYTQAQQIQQMDSEMKKLREKIKVQEKNIQIQKDEIKQWHDTFSDFEKSQKSNHSQDAELIKNKMKIQELEFQLHKRRISETNNSKQSTKRDESDLEYKLRSLLDENSKLTALIQTLQEEQQQKRNPTRQQLVQIKQELHGQQLYAQQELQRYRQIAIQNQLLQEQLTTAQEQIRILKKALDQLQDSESNDQLFEEFLQSQNTVLQLMDQII
ncbi:hypothetical protein pb186bvf_012348 [Paramecium bursaria]